MYMVNPTCGWFILIYRIYMYLSVEPCVCFFNRHSFILKCLRLFAHQSKGTPCCNLLCLNRKQNAVSRYVMRYQQCTIMDCILLHEELSVLVHIPASLQPLEVLRGYIFMRIPMTLQSCMTTVSAMNSPSTMHQTSVVGRDKGMPLPTWDNPAKASSMTTPTVFHFA